MKVLRLALDEEYFLLIEAGVKAEEYREVKPYWTKRLEGQTYDKIVLTWGYPKAGDPERTIERPWRGFTRKTITHKKFGNVPTEVYAIDVR